MSKVHGDSVAVVTGSSRGLGRYICERLLEANYQVVGCSRQPIESQHPRYTHCICDVANEAEVLQLFRTIKSKFGRLDVTINNAGVASMNHSLLTSFATFKKIADTNLGGTFLISRESAKLMRLNRFGRIVNLTTVAVPLHLAGECAYVAAKGGIEAMTKVMARELAEFGITVNAVGPSPVATDLTKGVQKAKLAALVDTLPTKKMSEPCDVYHAIDFFLQPDSHQITGQVLYLGGCS
jgi:3-oxoacyl-[acyl-carrier protein] reductase